VRVAVLKTKKKEGVIRALAEQQAHGKQEINSCDLYSNP
jgi:hypothetical protein